MVASALGGQTALLALPTKSTQTLESFPLPIQLKIAQTGGKKRGTAGGVLGNGMDVIKVAVVSKLILFVGSLYLICGFFTLFQMYYSRYLFHFNVVIVFLLT